MLKLGLLIPIKLYYKSRDISTLLGNSESIILKTLTITVPPKTPQFLFYLELLDVERTFIRHEVLIDVGFSYTITIPISMNTFLISSACYRVYIGTENLQNIEFEKTMLFFDLQYVRLECNSNLN